MFDRLKKGAGSLLRFPRVHEVLVRLFRDTAVTGRGSDACLRHGYLPVPVHFHSPVPDLADLEQRKVWDARSGLPGIDFREEAQLSLLQELGERYSGECRWPLDPGEEPAAFYLRNVSFSYGCAASTHCMIRHFRPRRVIEVGSGMSSRVISAALRTNGSGPSEYRIVDPYPGDPVRSGTITSSGLVERRVELVEPGFFSSLRENDILFIDSGHCVRIGGDVNHLFLEVLPRLAPGVVVHVHDICLPYEYPKVYATSETFRQFWTEQYLLQAYLSGNREFEILLAMHYLMTDHLQRFREAFPHYDPAVHLYTSGSFWIRRKPAGGESR
jgi:hypothetical protein